MSSEDIEAKPAYAPSVEGNPKKFDTLRETTQVTQVIALNTLDVADDPKDIPILERIEETLEERQLEPPDGGWYAWTQVAAGFTAYLVSWYVENPHSFPFYVIYIYIR